MESSENSSNETYESFAGAFDEYVNKKMSDLKPGKVVSGAVVKIGKDYVTVDIGFKTEGIIPAPETSHAIAAAIREANKAKEEGKEKVIIFNLSGHGLVDMTA